MCYNKFGDDMKILTVIFIIFIVIMLILIALIVSIKERVQRFLRGFNIGSMQDMINTMEEDENPKSLSGMDSLIMPDLRRDFPNINIDELKRQVESYVLTYIKSIETKNYIEIPNASDKVEKEIKNRISDYKTEVFKNIKIHKTVLNSYEKNNGFVTLRFQTALEYINEMDKKIQDRYQTELIYVTDERKVKVSDKQLGLNCPNCGSPIRNLGEKKCSYCNTGLVDLAKRVWYLNSIEKK